MKTHSIFVLSIFLLAFSHMTSSRILAQDSFAEEFKPLHDFIMNSGGDISMSQSTQCIKAGLKLYKELSDPNLLWSDTRNIQTLSSQAQSLCPTSIQITVVPGYPIPLFSIPDEKKIYQIDKEEGKFNVVTFHRDLAGIPMALRTFDKKKAQVFIEENLKHKGIIKTQEEIELKLQKMVKSEIVGNEFMKLVADNSKLQATLPIYHTYYDPDQSIVMLLQKKAHMNMASYQERNDKTLSDNNLANIVVNSFKILSELYNDFHLIHRDLTAPNLLVSRDPKGFTRVSLGDFGLAKQSEVIEKSSNKGLGPYNSSVFNRKTLQNSLEALGNPPKKVKTNRFNNSPDNAHIMDCVSMAMTLYPLVSQRSDFTLALRSLGQYYLNSNEELTEKRLHKFSQMWERVVSMALNRINKTKNSMRRNLSLALLQIIGDEVSAKDALEILQYHLSQVEDKTEGPSSYSDDELGDDPPIHCTSTYLLERED